MLFYLFFLYCLQKYFIFMFFPFSFISPFEITIYLTMIIRDDSNPIFKNNVVFSCK